MLPRAMPVREAGLGAGLVLLAAAVAYETAHLTVGFSYDKVGPRTFPYLIAAGLFLSGVSILVAAMSAAPSRQAPERHDWLAIGLISAALLLQMFFIRAVGWIPCATIGFMIVAWAFGSRRVVVSLVFGALFATATFVVFNYGLGLHLPVGSLFQRLFAPAG